MSYAVGIPTRNREAMLARTLDALSTQTHSPDLIIIVDNNDNPKTQDISNGIVRVACDYRTTGPDQGCQTALKYAARADIPVFVKWDDDLIPELTCLRKLVGQVFDKKAVACGGMYPKPDDDKRSSDKGAADGNDRHLQMFRWEGGHKLIERKHLHSCYAMDIYTALLVGGFCVDYSRFGQRGETDLSLRLAKEGRLLVDTSAVAEHHFAPGGRRFAEMEMMVLANRDNDLFVRRMIEHKIDVENW